MENKVKKSNNLKYIILCLLIIILINIAGYFILNSVFEEDIVTNIGEKKIDISIQSDEELQLVKAEKFEIP